MKTLNLKIEIFIVFFRVVQKFALKNLKTAKKKKIWFFPKNGGIHFYHNVQAFNVDSRSTLKA